MTDSPISERTDRIRQLNDRLRMLKGGGRIHFTGILAQEDEAKRLQVLHSVAKFNAFNEGDDPYGEHDFGALTIDGEKYYFKIDYLDHDLRFASEDPADPEKTTRIMSIFHSSDY